MIRDEKNAKLEQKKTFERNYDENGAKNCLNSPI